MFFTELNKYDGTTGDQIIAMYQDMDEEAFALLLNEENPETRIELLKMIPPEYPGIRKFLMGTLDRQKMNSQ